MVLIATLGPSVQANSIEAIPSPSAHQPIECGNPANRAATPALIPAPASIELKAGTFPVDRLAAIHATDRIPGRDRILAQIDTMLLAPLGLRRVPQPTPGGAATVLDIDPTIAAPEGFRLEIAPGSLRLTGADAAGLFHGLQALRQLSRPDGRPASGLPCLRIVDAPRFPWRGLHLDVSRHFMPKAFILKLLDGMALHRLNRFHWHLTDGPGWRLEVPAYPRLTAIGAWRKDKTDRPWDWRATELCLEGRDKADGPLHGGFYSRQDVTEIVAYARERHIEIVPEIEQPGHAYAALAAYPALACAGNNVLTEGLRGKDVLCVGNDASLEFVKAVVDETLRQFPGAIIHIGGDEVPHDAWRACPRCRKRMEDLGIKTFGELEDWFVAQVAAHVRAAGRTPAAWDECADRKPPEGILVTAWRGDRHAAAAATKGLDVVQCPMIPWYLNMRQAEGTGEPASEPQLATLSMAYAFDPASAIPGGRKARILGGQACIWTEHLRTPAEVEYMAFPRICALAERLWSPEACRDEADFLRRLRTHLGLLSSLGWRYRDGFAKGDLAPPAGTGSAHDIHTNQPHERK